MDRPEATSNSVSNALYLTKGYLDPSVVQGGQYSTTTDGYAVGVTLLVCLTRRSPLQIFSHCETDFDTVGARAARAQGSASSGGSGSVQAKPGAGGEKYVEESDSP